jgi:hypothetical protein
VTSSTAKIVNRAELVGQVTKALSVNKFGNAMIAFPMRADVKKLIDNDLQFGRKLYGSHRNRVSDRGKRWAEPNQIMANPGPIKTTSD